MVFPRTIFPYLLLLFLFLHSCISDSYDRCLGIRLALSYPSEGERCDRIHIFVFDERGSLFSSYEKTGRQLAPGVTYLLQVPPGKYTVVAWGDVHGDYSFTRKDITRASTPQMIPGSELERFRMLVALDKDLNTLSRPLNPVFHTSEYNIDLKEGQTSEVALEFVKNTNRIRVKASGLPSGVSSEKLDVGIRSSNWQYHFDNSVPRDAADITYKPYEKKVDKEVSISDLSVLRLIDSGSPVFYIKDGDTGDILYQRNLISLLMNLPYTDLDKEDYFEIELDFEGPTIAIKINGWEIIDNSQDVS